ncbi:hypothetical protein C3432_11630 [Citrobacter amalonaticus]|uniref:Cyclophilin-like domain-containing protein n=2 Tax=Citrobacter amalonaticus TaxID=35703 RepID=A0A2S4S0Y3_CITAM|nr:hypothetical protein C3432_11630 [Citrobacter amalonaticus]POT78248.1 hypothetical protein C3436_00190 [Citrobacter amalonaticus]POU67086.1 hypothetical protein C3430_09830 [Citrobacter amalonaticus]POV06282.1 hypothetical protein C3424_07495 [Citrobacter amalonaticus]
MKKSGLSLLLMANFVFPVNANVAAAQTNGENLMTIKMTIDRQSYTVELADNSAAKALIKQLPLTLTMEELNGNEKFADLMHPLPTSPTTPGIIHKGDVMLYGRETLVLFYATFHTTYRYTPIGRVVAADLLPEAVGHGGITVNFSKMK